MEESDQNLNTESDEDEIITSFENLLLHPRIYTTSVLKRLMMEDYSKLRKDFKENFFENFLENLKELIRVSSLLKNDKGETIETEKYKEMCKECFHEDDEGMEVLEISIPKDIEVIKELSNYSVDEIDWIGIVLCEEWEREQLNIQKFLKSFGSTKIEEFRFEGHSILVEDQSSSRDSHRIYLYKVFPCSNIFLELRHAVSRVTDFIEISYLELKGKEFCQLVRASIHALELQFRNCKILTDTKFDFGEMEGCKIEALQIDDDYQVYDNQSDYEETVMKIFVAIIKCSNLIRSLRKLSFNYNEYGMKYSLLNRAKEELNDIDYKKVKKILETSYI